MAECSECGESVSMPFSCKFCGESYCSSHRLPENHDCGGLEDYREKNREESDEITYDIQRKEQEAKNHGEGSEKPLLAKVKGRYRSIKRKIKRWLSGSGERPIGGRRQRSPVTGAMQQAFPEIATFTLLGSIFVVFLLQMGIPGVDRAFSLVPVHVFQEPWRLLSSMFMHANSAHLLVNAMVLFFFGAELEKRIGTRRFLKLYFIAGFVAALGFVGFAYLTGNTQVPAVGASGALYGVFAALAIIAPEIKVLAFFFVPMGIRTALVVFAVLDLVLLNTGAPIASSAHLSGLAVGLYYGYRLKGQASKRFDMLSL